jgi:hypothetical protein
LASVSAVMLGKSATDAISVQVGVQLAAFARAMSYEVCLHSIAGRAAGLFSAKKRKGQAG